MIQKEIKAWVIRWDCVKASPDEPDKFFCKETKAGGAIYSDDGVPFYFRTKKDAQDYLKTHTVKKYRSERVVESVMLRKHKPLTVAEANFLSCVILLDEHSIPHDFATEAEEIRERNYQWFSDLVAKRALQ